MADRSKSSTESRTVHGRIKQTLCRSMKKSEFQKEIQNTLTPKLEALGFEEVSLKDCIHPEVLFNKDRLWFGASWDYRDQYLEVDLGHLYWFQDVMPRVIILGNYSTYCSRLKSLPPDADNYLKRVAESVRDSIEDAMAVYNKRYDEILATSKNPKNLKYRAEFFSHLGSEVSRDELAKFAT